jgi:hypothetical protein
MTENGNRGVSTILNGARPEGRRLAGASPGGSSNLADLLERVLDKGIIIAGDITLCLGAIELLQIKVRLLIASVDKARDMGIDWWQHDPALSSAAHKVGAEGRDQLAERLDRLETMLTSLVQEREKQLPLATAISSQEPNDAALPPAVVECPPDAPGLRQSPVPDAYSAGRG